jgi:hypothetical protein
MNNERKKKSRKKLNSRQKSATNGRKVAKKLRPTNHAEGV